MMLVCRYSWIIWRNWLFQVHHNFDLLKKSQKIIELSESCYWLQPAKKLITFLPLSSIDFSYWFYITKMWGSFFILELTYLYSFCLCSANSTFSFMSLLQNDELSHLLSPITHLFLLVLKNSNNNNWGRSGCLAPSLANFLIAWFA